MKTAKSQKIVAGLCFLLALVLLAAGLWGLVSRQQAKTFDTLNKMRSYSVMAAAHQPLIKQLELEAGRKAYEKAEADGMSRKQRTEYMAQQEALAREQSRVELQPGFASTSPGYEEAILNLDKELKSYYEALRQEEQAFLAQKAAARPPFRWRKQRPRRRRTWLWRPRSLRTPCAPCLTT